MKSRLILRGKAPAWRRAALGLLALVFTAGPGRADESDTPLRAAAERLVPGAEFEPRPFEKAGERYTCLRFPAARGEAPGFVFRTAPLAPGIEGFGGPLDLAVAVREDGELLGVEILESRETRAYLEQVRAWLPVLEGRRMFGPSDLHEVDALTGATVSAVAILDTLQTAGHAFAAHVLDQVGDPAPNPRTRRVQDMLLLPAFVAAALLRFRPSRRLRQVWLVAVVLGFGVLWNLQFSLGALFRLVRFTWPPVAWTASFLLVVAVPAITLLAGNLYCGWVCPFGALQELAGDWRGRRVLFDPDRPAWTRIRRIKYLVLALALVPAGFTSAGWLADRDPLAFAFGPERTSPVFLFAVALLGLSVCFGRFWCRNLCPAGAALSLLGRISPLRNRWPRIQPGRCDLGVAQRHAADCLLCDRCRQPGDRPEPPPWTAGTRAGLLCAVVAAALAVWLWAGLLA